MAEEGTNAPRDHSGKFKRLVAPRNSVDHAIRVLARDDQPETLVALFDGRASYHTIRSWRKRARAPQWAVDLLRAKTATWRAAVDAMLVGPGRAAGWRNVKGYQLNMRR